MEIPPALADKPLVPRAVLQRLGINPLKAQTFRLANGQSIERQIGGALFKYQDRVGVATVIFGEEEDSTLLGAYTLESMGLSLDPGAGRAISALERVSNPSFPAMVMAS